MVKMYKIERFLSRINPLNYMAVYAEDYKDLEDSLRQYKERYSAVYDERSKLYREYVARAQEGVEDFPLTIPHYRAENELRHDHDDLRCYYRATKVDNTDKHPVVEFAHTDFPYILDYLMYKKYGLFLRDCRLPVKENNGKL